MIRTLLLMGLGIASLYAQGRRYINDNSFTPRQMGGYQEGRRDGKCTIRVRIDDEADVELRGNRVIIHVVKGAPGRDEGSECNSPLPYGGLSNFQFRGVDGRGQVRLVQEPRDSNRWSAVVNIVDSKGGDEGYTFDLTWNYDGSGNSGGGNGGFFPGNGGNRPGRPGRWPNNNNGNSGGNFQTNNGNGNVRMGNRGTQLQRANVEFRNDGNFTLTMYSNNSSNNNSTTLTGTWQNNGNNNYSVQVNDGLDANANGNGNISINGNSITQVNISGNSRSGRFNVQWNGNGGGGGFFPQ